MRDLELAIKCLENVEDTSKRNEKRDLLRSAAENPVLRELFKRAYDWKTTYGITWVHPEIPSAKALFGNSYSMEEEWSLFLSLLDALAARTLTGADAKTTITDFMHALGGTNAAERAKWYGRVINRNLQCGANVGTYGAVWPELRSSFGVSLAEKFKEYHGDVDYTPGVAVEPKLDGFRITTIYFDGKGVGKTRKGLEYNEVLKYILGSLGPLVGTGAVDGEVKALWEPTGPLSTYGGKRYKSSWGKTSAMVKTGYYHGEFRPDRITDEMWEQLRTELQFHAFDYMSVDVYDADHRKDARSLADRRANLEKLVGSLPDSSIVRLVPQQVVYSREEYDAFHVQCMQDGFEGSMLKVLTAPYLPDRYVSMLKRKEEELVDAVILEVLPGDAGKRNADWAGRYRLRLLTTGEEVRCNVRGDANRHDHWLRKEELVGTVVEVERQKDESKVASARNPIFVRLRDDLPRVEV